MESVCAEATNHNIFTFVAYRTERTEIVQRLQSTVCCDKLIVIQILQVISILRTHDILRNLLVSSRASAAERACTRPSRRHFLYVRVGLGRHENLWGGIRNSESISGIIFGQELVLLTAFPCSARAATMPLDDSAKGTKVLACNIRN